VEIYVDYVGVKRPKSHFREEEVKGLSGVCRIVVEHLRNLDNTFANVERAGGTISGKKSGRSWTGE
jgi:hypothetical protein